MQQHFFFLFAKKFYNIICERNVKESFNGKGQTNSIQNKVDRFYVNVRRVVVLSNITSSNKYKSQIKRRNFPHSIGMNKFFLSQNFNFFPLRMTFKRKEETLFYIIQDHTVGSTFFGHIPGAVPATTLGNTIFVKINWTAKFRVTLRKYEYFFSRNVQTFVEIFFSRKFAWAQPINIHNL